ncbi:hypothetical protein CDD83_9623 [Cordyceps sp. RAO-2017]|nr:hypothetical protein CDD83_9623 [Cordyceps sp. RAO-2017]
MPSPECHQIALLPRPLVALPLLHVASTPAHLQRAVSFETVSFSGCHRTPSTSPADPSGSTVWPAVQGLDDVAGLEQPARACREPTAQRNGRHRRVLSETSARARDGLTSRPSLPVSSGSAAATTDEYARSREQQRLDPRPRRRLRPSPAHVTPRPEEEERRGKRGKIHERD